MQSCKDLLKPIRYIYLMNCRCFASCGNVALFIIVATRQNHQMTRSITPTIAIAPCLQIADVAGGISEEHRSHARAIVAGLPQYKPQARINKTNVVLREFEMVCITLGSLYPTSNINNVYMSPGV